MRVIYRTSPVATTLSTPDGKQTPGSSFFNLILHEPGDNPALHGDTSVRPLSRYRTARGQPASMGPPPAFVGAEPITLPSALLDTLPDTALLEFQWRFERSQ